MERARITRIAEFDALRAQWDELYAADPLARFFVSAPWLRAFLPGARYAWTILTLRENGRLAAALPLARHPIPHRRLPIATEVTFACAPYADYGGLLCRPGAEDAAAAAFAEEIRAMSWQRASFVDIADPRFEPILRTLRSVGPSESAAQSLCPQIDLPSSWEGWLATLSSKTRYNTVHPLRLAEQLPGYRYSTASDGDLDEHVEALLQVHHHRWGGNLRRARERYGRLFRAAAAQGALRLHVIWSDARPVAAGASFVDPVRRWFGFYQVGFDPEFARASPGKAILALSIRDAIELGCTTFDFLRGDESYKRAYASGVVETRRERFARHGLRSAAFDAVLPSYRALRRLGARVVYGPGRTV